MNPKLTLDIARLAKERCREQVLLTIQVLDNDLDRGAVLLSIAGDMIVGASTFLDFTEEEVASAILESYKRQAAKNG